jgi:hypothetical protein
VNNSPNLEVGYLFRTGLDSFKLFPAHCVGMFFVYSFFNGTGTGGTGGETGDDRVDLILLVLLIGFSCLSLIVGPPLKGGMQMAYTRMLRGDENVSMGDLFSAFGDGEKFLNLVLLNVILMGVFLLGFLLCIAPGIVALCGLWPAYMLVMEEDMNAVDALKKAWKLTDGHKVSIFIYGLCAALLQVLGVLACCIGVFVTGPIAELGWMQMYRELRGDDDEDRLSTDEYVPGTDFPVTDSEEPV